MTGRRDDQAAGARGRPPQRMPFSLRIRPELLVEIEAFAITAHPDGTDGVR
ncbi:hypothetical protein OIE62_33250 [Streptomyces scopuliridis]|uniref:Uncharacterized protein n=1 Tax=Streptomyces scopuliridis TaxID=452529 RepID=A0ACD4ZEJ7_9ACTN|nr:hypothetical protein [Streptomyces scopuliridis]WSB32640.1 hypothetical protein OG949_07085 [Streptomyces scopuliridis]WSB96890.1 hypothetical protein OG835_07685 [Streptomyces scopuliridis]WSC09406.1 hypothetical protein OIE62_33250 [Streptomyces scopuliridis]